MMESFGKHFKKVVGVAAVAGAVEGAQAQTGNTVNSTENSNNQQEYDSSQEVSKKIFEQVLKLEETLKNQAKSIAHVDKKIIAIISESDLNNKYHYDQSGVLDNSVSEWLLVDISNSESNFGVVDRSLNWRQAQKDEFDLRATGLIDQEQHQEIKYLSPDYYVVVEKIRVDNGYDFIERIYSMKDKTLIDEISTKIVDGESDEVIVKKIGDLNNSVFQSIQNYTK